MNTDQNKIEENEPSKILTPDVSNELKFGNINTILPYQINFPIDSDSKIIATVAEEKKVVNRLKLSNWWKHIKSLLLKWYHKITTLTGTTTVSTIVIPKETISSPLKNDTIE